MQHLGINFGGTFRFEVGFSIWVIGVFSWCDFYRAACNADASAVRHMRDP